MVFLRQAKAVSIEGHPSPAHNGLYTHDSTHEGWPVLKNASGRYCYRYTPGDRWHLASEHRPDSDLRNASIVAEEGPLPIGAHAWQVVVDNDWEDRTLAVTLLPTEAEVLVAERRFKAALEAEQVPKAAAARAQLTGVRSVTVYECPHAECNGTFERLTDVDGWPRFRNGQGQLLFYHAKGQQWVIHSVFTEEFGVVAASIDARDGLLPTGEEARWLCRGESGGSYEKMRAALGEA